MSTRVAMLKFKHLEQNQRLLDCHLLGILEGWGFREVLQQGALEQRVWRPKEVVLPPTLQSRRKQADGVWFFGAHNSEFGCVLSVKLHNAPHQGP